jgi:hypothetical protein
MDVMEKDFTNLDLVNWRAKADERDCSRKFLEQAKTHKGL